MNLTEIQQAQADLPIWSVLKDLCEQLAGHPRGILVAEPGAGKSSIVPLALLDAPWLAGRKVLLLEPRRLAARSLAWRLAELSGQPLGRLVGLRTRDDTLVSAATRIEVLTEALLTRRIQADPELADVGLVIFDEFHERSLHADLGLALAREVQSGLRADLRLLIMSATLDEQRLAADLDAPVLRCAGRGFAVEIRHQPPRPGQDLDEVVAARVGAALREESGSVLVFLPGEGEIRRVHQRLEQVAGSASIHPLYGRLDRAAQQAAIAPPRPGERKIVLATAVAETSLTIAGVRVVIDSGLARLAIYDPNVGFSALVTRRVSRDSADQRAGRAGRTEPGLCIRLWSAEEILAPVREPDIRRADLAGAALACAAWGSEPPWLEAPPAGAWAQAHDVLRMLDLIDAGRRITAEGRRVNDWGCEPRLGRLLLEAEARDALPMGCDLVALLESDLRASSHGDIHRLWLDWRHSRRRQPQLEQASQRWRRRLKLSDEVVESDPGPLLAAAFVDRIALPRGRGWLLANGRGARLPEGDALCGAEALVVVRLDGREEARIRLAASLERAQLEARFATHMETREQVRFNPANDSVQARRQRRLGALVLDDQILPQASPEALVTALLQALAERGVEAWPWSDSGRQLLARLRLMQARDDAWPDFSDTALLAQLGEWLGPYLAGVRKLSQLRPEQLSEALLARLSAGQQQRLREQAPTHFQLPGGRRVALDYAAEDGPVLALRMQDLYGLDETPRVAGQPVLLHLLSPARRPLAVTRDLPSFWRNAYVEVRKQMRGRYPKHHWPEQPWLASAQKPR